MAQQTGSYDFKAANAAHDEAAEVATNYIFKSTGHDAWVCDENAGPGSDGEATSTTTGWRLGSVFELVKQGVSWFKLWVENNVAKLRLGRADQSHVILDSDSLDIEDSTGIAVASFGEYSHIGKQRNSSHVRISPSAFAVGTYTDSSGYSTPSKDPSYLDQGVLVGNNALVVKNGGYNTLSVNALGLQLKPANHLAASISDGDASFYKTVLGGEEKTASFGSDGWQVGLDDESHMVGDYHSLQMVDKDGDTYFHVSDLRDSDGFIVETFTAPGGTNVFSLMTYPSSNPRGWATIDGETATVTNLSTSSQQCIVLPTPEEGAVVVIGYIPRSYRFTKAFTFGTRIAAEQVGAMSFCEGLSNVARGEASHAEGEHNVANEYGAHAEGAGCTALGSMAHAEGSGTLAGYVAHAEGQDTTASQTGSHSQNVGTKAAKMGQTALGSYNVADSASTTTHPSGTSSYGQYAVIVGNGTDDNARSNALTVDWEGVVETAGRIKSGGSVGFSYSNLANRATISRSGDYIYLLAVDANDDYVGQYRFNMTTWGFACRFWDSSSSAWGSWESHVWNALASRTANTVLAAPNGSAGAATFRALVPDDIPWVGDRTTIVSSGTDKTIATGTWTDLGTFTVTAGRKYLATFHTEWNAHSGGAVSHAANVSVAAPNNDTTSSFVTSGAVNNIERLTSMAMYQPTSNTTYHFCCHQGTGANLTLRGYSAYLMRIG